MEEYIKQSFRKIQIVPVALDILGDSLKKVNNFEYESICPYVPAGIKGLRNLVVYSNKNIVHCHNCGYKSGTIGFVYSMLYDSNEVFSFLLKHSKIEDNNIRNYFLQKTAEKDLVRNLSKIEVILKDLIFEENKKL